MENDVFTITINFAEQKWNPQIRRCDEKRYRDAAICVDNKIQVYRKKFPKKGMEYHLSLVSLELALELLKEKEEKSSTCQRMETLMGELKENLKK